MGGQFHGQTRHRNFSAQDGKGANVHGLSARWAETTESEVGESRGTSTGEVAFSEAGGVGQGSQ